MKPDPSNNKEKGKKGANLKKKKVKKTLWELIGGEKESCRRGKRPRVEVASKFAIYLGHLI